MSEGSAMAARTKSDPDAAKKRALRQLQWVTRRREKEELSHRSAMRAAAAAGASLREIAEAAGVGHMTVKRVLERE